MRWVLERREVRMPRWFFLTLAETGLSLVLIQAQYPARPPAVPKETLPPVLTPWEMVDTHTRQNDNRPFPSHRVIGNVFYVGTADYASFLIASDRGHIFI